MRNRRRLCEAPPSCSSYIIYHFDDDDECCCVLWLVLLLLMWADAARRTTGVVVWLVKKSFCERVVLDLEGSHILVLKKQKNKKYLYNAKNKKSRI